ncbi:MAG: pantetheine-phosphate adenylyltransferase [Flavobacteriales bacterium]
MKHRRAFFPGSFDPFTKGHEAIVHKGISLFDEVIIGLGTHSSKTPYFDLATRKAHIASLFKNLPVQVIDYSGLTIRACEHHECSFILRGLRDTKDFQYERSIAQMNVEMASIETVFLLTDLKNSAINATIVREIHQQGGEIDKFVTNAHLLVK